MVDGAQKMVKMYDGLMRSGKFTAAQNKAENGEFIDSLGEMFELCEKKGYVERFYIDTPNDKVDLTIQDMQRYVQKLVMSETNLGDMIEKAIKDNQKEDIESAENTETDIVDFEDEDFDNIEKSILEDVDFEEFGDFKDQEQMSDEDLVKSFLDSKGDF